MSETGERSDVADNAAGGVFTQSTRGGSGDVQPKRPDDQQRMEALECLRHLCPDRREERGQAFHLEQMDNPRWGADAPAGLAVGVDREEARQNKRPKVMPDQFDGKSSWPDYLAHFEICSEINGWNFQQRTQYLSVSLRGTACQVMNNLPLHRRRDYRELVTALGRRFNPENQSELYRVQLRNRLRRTNESLPELGQHIRQLVSQAYPGANADVLDVLGKDYFIDSIDDPDIRWRIYQTKPENLDGAICTAVEFEAYKSAEKQRTSGKRYVRDVQYKPNATTQRSSRDHSVIDELKKQVEELKRKLQDQAMRRGTTGQTSYLHDGKQSSNVRCWNCGEIGHVMRNCPHESKTEMSN